MTRGFTDAIKRRVIAEDTAEDIGEIKTFVCDPTGTRITQLQVAGRKRHPELVDFEAVSSFGDDAVLIRAASAVHDSVDDRTEDMVKGDIEYIGSRVLSTDGQEHGVVTDVHFDERSGEIIAFLGDTVGRVEAASICSLGSYAVIVDPPAES